MSFGKDPKGLGRVPAFGGANMQQRKQFMNDRNRSQGGSRGRRFSDEYKPPMSPGADMGRLLPGNFAVNVPGDDRGDSTFEMQFEYFPWVEHFDGRTKRSSTCSGGPLHNFKGKRGDCRGCDIYYSGAEKKRMSKTDKFSFSFLHYANYHKIESLDQSTGQIKMNTSTNQPYYDWVPCEGRTCTSCRANKETTMGRVRPWAMGYTHFTTLIDAYSPLIGRSCANCSSKDSIQCAAWVCPVEGCGEGVIDMSTSTMTDADIAKIVVREVKCPACQNLVFLREMISCTSCGSPRRASIFDVDISVQRIDQSKNGGQQTGLLLTTWSNPQPVAPQFTEIAKSLALDKMYGPTSIEQQERSFDMQGTTPVQNQGYRPYGQQQPQPGPGFVPQQQVPMGIPQQAPPGFMQPNPGYQPAVPGQMLPQQQPGFVPPQGFPGGSPQGGGPNYG